MYPEYRHVAAALGLRMQPPDPGMMTFSFDLHGEIDGQPVSMTRFAGRGAHYVARAPLRRHLDLGIGVGRTGVLWQVAEWLGAREIKIGVPDFDADFVLRGDEPSRVIALLTPELRAALEGVGGDFELTDAHVSLRRDASDENQAMLEHALRSVAWVARAVEIARLAVPPAKALIPLHAALVRYAEENRFVGEATPLWMHGNVGRYAATVRAFRAEANHFLVETAVYLEEPWKGQWFFARPRLGVVDRMLARLAKTHDADFDRVFDVSSASPEYALALLDDEVRPRLLSLAKEGRVHANPNRISLTQDAARFEPASLSHHIEEMRVMLDAFTRKGGTPGPAYR